MQKTPYLVAAIALFIVLSLIAPESAHALRSTKQESFTDPDYIGYQPTAVLLLVLSDNLEIREVIEKRLTKELEKRGITVYRERDLFPPTREWSQSHRVEIFAKFGIEAGMVIATGASSHEVSQIGSQTWGSGTATSYGNTTSFSGNSTTTPIIRASSNSSFSGVLIDLETGRTAWTTDVYTKAGGLLFAGGKKDAKAASKAVIKGLVEKGHLPAK